MLTFIDVKRFKTSKPNEEPEMGYFSFSDNDSNPKERLFVSSLCHGENIIFDKENAQKMIAFLQKNVIDAPEVKNG